jgi:carboxymethylenebutenolidase
LVESHQGREYQAWRQAVTLIERHVDIPTPACAMDTFIARPDGAPAPLVIVCMDIWGVRPQLFDIARRIAGEGYCASVPNFYHRDGVNGFDFRNERGQTISMERATREQQEAVRKHGAALTNAMVDEDAGALLKYFEREPVSQGPAGSVGFCMGGRHAMYIAGTRSERLQATASLHGTQLVSDKPDSPHRFADRFRGEIYCGFAEHDPYVPPSIASALEKLLAGRSSVKYRAVTHPRAAHGYAIPDRDVYDHAAAERDWAAIFAMFARVLR